MFSLEKIRKNVIIFNFCVGIALSYRELYFNQTIDHFRFYNNDFISKKFPQRYLLEDKWWNPPTGPIFFYTGNEGPIDVFWKNTGFVFDIAPKFQALIVFAEHRYYGKSLPFPVESCFKHPYVDLLTVEQALADYAVLINDLKTRLNATGPVIAFGGSYGGMLTAYMRFKYPNLVHAGIAASAPIYLVSEQVPRDFFFKQVTQDFDAAGCKDRVMQGFTTLQMLAQTGNQGLKTISEMFHLCRPLKNLQDFRHLLLWIRNAFTNLAMFDYPYVTSVFSSLPAYPVQASCDLIKQSNSTVNWLPKVMALYYGNLAKCRDIWSEFVECADPTGCGLGPNSKAWDYQACTEMIMPAGSDNVTDMFPVLPFTLQQRADYCQNAWNVEPRNNWMNVQMWGKDISSASNLVFSNGNLDPWRGGGVVRNISRSVVSVLIEGGAHHLDLRGRNKNDPPSVISARKLETSLIDQWIKQYSQSV